MGQRSAIRSYGCFPHRKSGWTLALYGIRPLFGVPQMLSIEWTTAFCSGSQLANLHVLSGGLECTHLTPIALTFNKKCSTCDTHTQWPVATYGWIVTSLLQYIAMYKVRLEMLNHCVRVLLMCTYGDIVGIANELHNACRCLNWDTNYTLHNYHVVGKLLVAPGYPYLYIIGKTDTGNNLSSKPISTNPTG